MMITSDEESFEVETDPFYAEDLRQMQKAVNYRDWQFRMVEPFLGKRVLEMGDGIGNFTPQHASSGRSVTKEEKS